MSNNEKQILSYNIKYLRKKNRMTQAELARLLEVRQTTVSEWESSRSEPDSISILTKICDIFKVTYDDLLSNQIDKNDENDSGGSIIARRLENLSEEERNEAEKDIMNFLNFKYGNK